MLFLGLIKFPDFFSACVEASVEAQLLEYIYIAIYVTKGSRLRGGYRERVIHALSTVYAGAQCKPARALLEVVELVLKPVAFLRAASQSLCRQSGWDLPCRSRCKKAVKTKLVDLVQVWEVSRGNWPPWPCPWEGKWGNWP